MKAFLIHHTEHNVNTFNQDYYSEQIKEEAIHKIYSKIYELKIAYKTSIGKLGGTKPLGAYVGG
jgi:hypothetical protein